MYTALEGLNNAFLLFWSLSFASYLDGIVLWKNVASALVGLSTGVLSMINTNITVQKITNNTRSILEMEKI